MIQLLESYSLSQILIMIIFIIIAVKETWDFVDWVKEKIHKRDTNIKNEQDEKEDGEERVERLETGYTEVLTTLTGLTDKVDFYNTKKEGTKVEETTRESISKDEVVLTDDDLPF